MRLELIAPDLLAVAFAYDAEIVSRLKLLTRRKWNPAKKYWEVHLAHLPDLTRIFHLGVADISEPIRERYAMVWAKGAPLRVELGVIEGRLIGNAPLAQIDAATSFEVPGAEYSELYQSGRWDGRKHLFSRKTQTFPAGLWSRVKAVLDQAEVNYELHEPGRAERPSLSEPVIATTDRPLRPYQADAVAEALSAGRGILQIATGGGKTLVAANLIRRIGRPALFFVHTLDLLYQAAAVFERELGCEIGLLGDGQARLRPVTVATIQTAGRLYDAASVRANDRATAKASKTLKKRKPKEDNDEDEFERVERPLEIDEATRREISLAIARAELVIFDECHHVPADTFYRIAMKTRAAHWRYGLSATPWRDDHNDLLLEAALGPKLCAVNASRLIEDGFLVAPHIKLHPAPGPRWPRRRGFKYADVYRRAIVENHERNRFIAAQARNWAGQGLSALILVTQVAHGQLLQELLPEAVFCWGGLDGVTRQGHLQALRDKLAPIMIATTLADEGLDVPSLDAVILAGGGKSPTRAFQRIGRALRLGPGKRQAHILDFFDDAPFLRDHSQARLDLYRQEPRFQIEAAGLHAPGSPCPIAC